MEIPDRFRIEGRSDRDAFLTWGVVALFVIALVVAVVASFAAGGYPAGY